MSYAEPPRPHSYSCLNDAKVQDSLFWNKVYLPCFTYKLLQLLMYMFQLFRAFQFQSWMFGSTLHYTVSTFPTNVDHLKHYFLTHYRKTCFAPQFLNSAIHTIHNKASHLSFSASAFLCEETWA
jgi:hypothetical protein